ncbi:MAG: OmpA family protein [Acidobacteriota bacterium]
MSVELEEEEQEEELSAPAWVVQFGDMMSLLLVFFILLLSFSEIDAVKYRALSDAMREAFGSVKLKDMFSDPQANQSVLEQTGGRNDAILEELRSIIPQTFPGALPDQFSGRSYLMRVPGEVLFETGKAELRPEMKPKLREIAELLKRRPEVTLRVDGHTDDVPIHNDRFPSNWELSAARALAVVHFLIDECGIPADRVAAAAFGESRPLVPNDSEENRRMNRRVEFRFIESSPAAEANDYAREQLSLVAGE